MNIAELKRALEQQGLSPARYSLDGSARTDQYVLRQVYGRWEVFYLDERGNENDNRWFDSESDACAHLLRLLEKERTYRSLYL